MVRIGFPDGQRFRRLIFRGRRHSNTRSCKECLDLRPSLLASWSREETPDCLGHSLAAPPEEAEPAINTSVAFVEDGHIVARAEGLGQGEDIAVLGQGRFFAHPDSPNHKIRIDLNQGVVWSPQKGFPVPMLIVGRPAQLEVSRMRLRDCSVPVCPEVPENEITLISATADGTLYPKMPSIIADFTKPFGADLHWSLEITYTGHGRSDDDFFPAAGLPPERVLSSDVPWELSTEWGARFRGGNAMLHYKSEGIVEGYLPFLILGENPSEADAETAIPDIPWYTEAIARHESGYQGGRSYLQFNIGTVATHEPNWGRRNGWGMMQLDPPPSVVVLWDWRANIDGGMRVVSKKRRLAQDYFDFIHAQYPVEWESPPTYTPPGTTTTLDSLDAAAIQLFNGAKVVEPEFVGYDSDGSPKYIYHLSSWRFFPLAPPGNRWEFVPNKNDYVRVVIREYESRP